MQQVVRPQEQECSRQYSRASPVPCCPPPDRVSLRCWCSSEPTLPLAHDPSGLPSHEAAGPSLTAVAVAAGPGSQHLVLPLFNPSSPLQSIRLSTQLSMPLLPPAGADGAGPRSCALLPVPFSPPQALLGLDPGLAPFCYPFPAHRCCSGAGPRPSNPFFPLMQALLALDPGLAPFCCPIERTHISLLMLNLEAPGMLESESTNPEP